MSDDYNGSDDEYWDDMYYYENYDKKMDPNSWSGHSGSRTGNGFWIWFVSLIVACNISSSLGNIVLIIGVVLWIVNKLGK